MCCRKFSGLQSRNKREDHSSFSKSGIRFILFKQTKCQHRQFFLTSFSLTHPHFVTRAAGNTFIARSEITSLDNKIGDMCFLARFEHGFLNNHRIIKAQMASNENLKTDLFNHIHRMYKYDGAVSLQEWEACLESSIYGFVPLNRG